MNTIFYKRDRAEIEAQLRGIAFAFDSRDSRNADIRGLHAHVQIMLNGYERFAAVAVGHALVLFFDGAREAMEVPR